MKNRTLAALQEQGNLLGLGSFVAIAAATTSLAPLLIGAIIEAVYLVFVPHSAWFAGHLARQHSAEIGAQHEQLKREILPELRPDLQKRFARLEMQRANIERNANNEQLWMRELLSNLDFLLDKFLRFALKDEQFRAYLGQRCAGKLGDEFQNSPELSDRWARETVEILRRSYDGDLVQIALQLECETDEDTRATLVKRSEVLTRRREFVGRIGGIIGNLSQQLALLEDTFGLVGDELLARAPEQVLSDVEEVVSQTRALTRVLEEMVPLE